MTRDIEKPATARLEGEPAGYGEWLTDVKARVHAAQQRAALAVNQELLALYWQLGRDILERQGHEGWGAKVIDRLALDLKAAFPEVKGFSPRNLKYMRRLAEAWPEPAIVQQLLHKVPWFHLCTLLDKVKDRAERDWYLRATIQHGWSRNVLVMQIETSAHQRQGQAWTRRSNGSCPCLPLPTSPSAAPQSLNWPCPCWWRA